MSDLIDMQKLKDYVSSLSTSPLNEGTHGECLRRLTNNQPFPPPHAGTGWRSRRKKTGGICLDFFQDGKMVAGGFLISLTTG